MAYQVVRLKNDWRSIREAAITVSTAFADDPLIKWIRPGAQTWGDLDDASLKFQHRRLQRMNEEFVVFRLDSAPSTSQEDDKHPSVSVSEPGVHSTKDVDHGVIAMLEPPARPGLSLRHLFITVKYWFLDMFFPCRDPGNSEQRFSLMMEAHNNGLEALRRELYPRRPWYLEVIAVRPSLHGKGLGGKMMRGIIDQAGDAPIVLECTDRATINFYQKYGFEEVSKMALKDSTCPQDDMECYWMVRR